MSTFQVRCWRTGTPRIEAGSCFWTLWKPWCGAFLAKEAELESTPLAVLEAEIGRLEQLVAADRESARKVAAVSRRIAEERNAIASLKEKLADCRGARKGGDARCGT